MTPMHDAPDQWQADGLGAFGDALVDGHALPASTEIERAMERAYRVTQALDTSAAAMPKDVKYQIWEDLMEATAPSPAPSRPTVTLASTQRPVRPLADHHSLDRRGGWQAVASFTLMLAVLASLGSLIWYQGTDLSVGAPTPTTVAAQGLYDPDDISTYPMMPETCVPNGEVASDNELAQRSIDHWTPPEYAPAQAVPHDKAEAIQRTYMQYFRCEWDALHPDLPAGATPMPPVRESPEMLTYFSDRLRYDRLYNRLSPEQQNSLAAYRCEPRANRVLETFPLPVNQPTDYAMASLLPDGGKINELTMVFAPSDVYLLPDGRYGAISGTVSTAALTDPNAVTSDDDLFFIAFVEVGGRYYIDEMFTLISPNMDDLEAQGRNGTLVTDCE